MLFLGLGSGLGSTMIVDGSWNPWSWPTCPTGRVPTRITLGLRGLRQRGKKKWRLYVADVVAHLTTALEPDDVVLGGGNIKN